MTNVSVADEGCQTPPIISRGFRGRRDEAPGDGVPPGQYVTKDFPVLSAGPTPRVTKWSKLDTLWQGVSVDTLLDSTQTSAEYVVAFCDGGYTTNVPLEDVTGGNAWVALGYDGEPLDPEHGGPARMPSYHNYGDPWREQRYWGD